MKKTDTEKLKELKDYIKSRKYCVDTMQYPPDMAYFDILQVAAKL